MAAGRAGDGQGPGEAGEGGVSRQLAGAGAPAPAISSSVIKAGAAPPSLPPLSGPHQTLITAAGFYGERFGPLPASSASLTLRKHGAAIPAGSGPGHCLETARARPPTSTSLPEPAIGPYRHRLGARTRPARSAPEPAPDRQYPPRPGARSRPARSASEPAPRCTAPAAAPALPLWLWLSKLPCCWPWGSVPAPSPAPASLAQSWGLLAVQSPGVGQVCPLEVSPPPGQWSRGSFAVPRVLGWVSASPAAGGTRSSHSSATSLAPLCSLE